MSKFKILATSTPDLEVYRKINKINAIKRYHEDEDYQNVKIPSDSVIFTSDNWFIIFNNGAIINSCLLDFDKKAKVEFDVTTEIINHNITNDNKQINLGQLNDTVLQLQNQVQGESTKIRKLISRLKKQ